MQRAEGLAERKESSFVLEEEALHVEPAAEAGEGAVCADHAVARQHDRKRVAPVRGADRPGRVVAEPEPSRLLAVAHGLPVRNRREREPAAAVELRAVKL